MNLHEVEIRAIVVIPARSEKAAAAVAMTELENHFRVTEKETLSVDGHNVASKCAHCGRVLFEDDRMVLIDSEEDIYSCGLCWDRYHQPTG